MSRVWTKQPPAGTSIDWSNPLTRGLVFAAPDAVGNDAVSGNRPSIIRSGSVFEPMTYGKYGTALSAVNKSGANAARFYPDNYAHARVSGGDEVTLWSLQKKISDIDSWATPFGVDQNSSTTTPWFLGYSRNTTASSMILSLPAGPTGGNRYGTGTGLWLSNGELGSYCLTYRRSDSTRVRFYKNAVQVFSTAGADQTIGWASELNSDTIGLLDWDQSASQDNFTGGVALALMWNRALSHQEVLSLERNPWQIFKPKRRPLALVDESDVPLVYKQVPWVAAPPASAEIDWANPITKGLLRAYWGGNEILLNHTGRKSTFGPSVPADTYCSHGIANSAIVYGVTLDAAALWNSQAHYYRDTNAGYPNDEGLIVRSVKRYGRVQLLARTIGETAVVVDIDVTPAGELPLGRFSVFGATINSSQHVYAYFNGIPRGSDTTTWVGSTFDPPDQGQSVWGVNDTVADPGTLVSFVYRFGRELTDAEHKSLAENPWQIFKPRTVFALVETSAEFAITDVDTDETLEVGQTGITVTGTNMGTTNANRTFSVIQGAVEVDQTETGTGTDTSATLSLVFETGTTDLKHGSATLRCTKDDLTTADIAITINPTTGLIYVDLTSIYTDPAYRITAIPDLEIGDQIHARAVGGGSAPTGLTINADATFQFADGSTPTDFDVRAWDINTQEWGAWATQSFALAVQVGLLLESNLAFTLDKSKLKLLGLTTESEIALATEKAKLKGLIQAAESDLSLAVNKIKQKLLGLSSESDISLAIQTAAAILVGLSTESSSAFTVDKDKLKLLGQSNESDLPFTIDTLKSKLLELATQADSALILNRLKSQVLSSPVVADTTFSISKSKLKSVGLPIETDISLFIEFVGNVIIGLIEEFDSAFGVEKAKSKAVNQSTESDISLIVNRLKSQILDLPFETNSTFVIDHAKLREVGLPLENDQSLSIQFVGAILLGLLQEVDSALSINKLKEKVVDLPSDIETATSIDRIKSHLLNILTESDTSFTVDKDKVKLLGQSLEDNLSFVVEKSKLKLIGLTTEGDTSATIEITFNINIPVGLGIESDTGLAVDFSKLKALGLGTEVDLALGARAIVIKFIIETVDGRTLTVYVDGRVLRVGKENRTLQVEKENRTLYVK